MTSDNQLKDLSRMTAILSKNWKARVLAHSLWEFYNYHLYCTVRTDDGQPNRHRIHGIEAPETFGTIRVCVSIRDNDRKEEGLLHELLHANLAPLGYPRFWINNDRESEEYRRATGIINLADHKLMRPIFLDFGDSEDRFLGTTRPLNDLEMQIDARSQAVKSFLHYPAGYLQHVGKCLSDHGANFEPIDIPAAMLRERWAALSDHFSKR